MTASDAPVVVGVDPGQQRTGIVVRQAHQLAGWQVLNRPDGMTLDDWCHRVASRVASILVFEYPADVVAVEKTGAPNPHVGRHRPDGSDRGPRIIDPTPMLEATAVAWAVYGWLKGDRVVMVEPAGFSKAADERVAVLRQLFPRELVTTPKGELRDCRSAWLVAEAGVLQRRVARASTVAQPSRPVAARRQARGRKAFR